MNNNEGDLIDTEEPSTLQGRFEEADTLIALHASRVSSGNILVRSTNTDVLVILVRSTDTDVLVILVRSTDTDVLVILLGLAGRSERITIILDYLSGNHRRCIHVSTLAVNLDEKKRRLTEALTGFHSLTGCDFTSCFFDKAR